MKFTGKFVGITVNIKNFQQKLDQHLNELAINAAKAWLVGVLGRVPLWSGMARASLLELSELVNGNLILSPLRTKSRIPLGRTLGSAELKSKNNNVQITIETNVPHYNLQEFSRAAKGGSPRAPWHSLDAGELAFMQFVQNNLHLLKPTFTPVKFIVN